MPIFQMGGRFNCHIFCTFFLHFCPVKKKQNLCKKIKIKNVKKMENSQIASLKNN